MTTADLTDPELEELSGHVDGLVVDSADLELVAQVIAEVRRHRAALAEINRRIAAVPPGLGVTRSTLELCAQLLDGSRAADGGTAATLVDATSAARRATARKSRSVRRPAVEVYGRLIDAALALERSRAELDDLRSEFWGSPGARGVAADGDLSRRLADAWDSVRQLERERDVAAALALARRLLLSADDHTAAVTEAAVLVTRAQEHAWGNS